MTINIGKKAGITLAIIGILTGLFVAGGVVAGGIALNKTTAEKANATDTLMYTLDGTQTGHSTIYTYEDSVIQDGVEWKVQAKTMPAPWDIHGETGDNRVIYSVNYVDAAVNSFTITYGPMNVGIGVSILVDEDGDFDNPIYSKSMSIASNDTIFQIDRPAGQIWNKCYYKLIHSFGGSGNVQFKSIQFYGTESYPDPQIINCNVSEALAVANSTAPDDLTYDYYQVSGYIKPGIGPEKGVGEGRGEDWFEVRVVDNLSDSTYLSIYYDYDIYDRLECRYEASVVFKGKLTRISMYSNTPWLVEAELISSSGGDEITILNKTINETNEILDGMSPGDLSTTWYQVTGFVTSIEEPFVNGNKERYISVKISDVRGDTEHSLLIYRGVVSEAQSYRIAVDALITFIGRLGIGYTETDKTGTSRMLTYAGCIAVGSINSAEAFAGFFISKMTCDNSGNTAPTFLDGCSWDDFEGFYEGVYNKELLTAGVANQYSDSIVERALARYEYVVAKYNYNNFIGRTITPMSQAKINKIINTDTNTIILVVLSASIILVSLSGVILLLRKRKQQ